MYLLFALLNFDFCRLDSLPLDHQPVGITEDLLAAMGKRSKSGLRNKLVK